MKKCLPIVLSALTLLMILLPTAASAAGDVTMVVQAPLGLRLRADHDLTSNVKTFLFNGEEVIVTGQTVWNQAIEWSPIKVWRWGGWVEGWVATAYLGTYNGYPEPSDGYTGGGCKVLSGNGLRMRDCPGLDCDIVRIVPYGTILPKADAQKIDADGYTWKHLTLDGSTVWAASDFLKCKGW
jgi:hypothetical protein